MKNKIYEMPSTITKKEILSVCEFEEISGCGDVFSYHDFLEKVNTFCITDFDGTGELILNGKVVKNSSIWVCQRTVCFIGYFFVPFDVLLSIFGDEIKFIWYNK